MLREATQFVWRVTRQSQHLSDADTEQDTRRARLRVAAGADLGCSDTPVPDKLGDLITPRVGTESAHGRRKNFATGRLRAST